MLASMSGFDTKIYLWYFLHLTICPTLQNMNPIKKKLKDNTAARTWKFSQNYFVIIQKNTESWSVCLLANRGTNVSFGTNAAWAIIEFSQKWQIIALLKNNFIEHLKDGQEDSYINVPLNFCLQGYKYRQWINITRGLAMRKRGCVLLVW